MKRTLLYEITEKDSKITVTEFLKIHGFSRHLLIEIKNSEETVLLNGLPVRMNTLLANGDVIKITLPEEASSEHIPPVELPLTIVYEDEDLMVLNKPYDMPIHPSIGNYENTLANALAWYFKEQGETFVFRCINRLDRDTSGLLIGNCGFARFKIHTSSNDGFFNTGNWRVDGSSFRCNAFYYSYIFSMNCSSDHLVRKNSTA